MSQTMREGFEAAVIERMKESGFLEVEIRVEMLGRRGDDYDDPSVSAYWHFWQKAAASVVVALPKEGDMRGDGHFFDIGVEACKEAIEAAGGKVADETAPAEAKAPSYHDLHITTTQGERHSIFNLPYNLSVTCTRMGGWELWRQEQLVAGEYHDAGLRLDVAGHVIVDSLNKPTKGDDE